MEILVQNKTNEKIPKKVLPKIQTILNALACEDSELSVLFVDDLEMAEMNLAYRGKKGPTNVLSFPMNEGEFEDLNPEILGDIVISLDTAAREAREAEITFEERISQLSVHGILHLLGYDHEKSIEDELIMEKKSLELLRLIESNKNLEYF